MGIGMEHFKRFTDSIEFIDDKGHIVDKVEFADRKLDEEEVAEAEED